MAARLTDIQKQKIVADYVDTRSVNAVAKMNNVSWASVRSVLAGNEDLERKLEQKREENTKDVLAYMESQKSLVCEIIGKGLAALNHPDKLADASPAQITTALGTLIDKFSAIGGSGPNGEKEDGLSKSLREMGRELQSDD